MQDEEKMKSYHKNTIVVMLLLIEGLFQGSAIFYNLIYKGKVIFVCRRGL